MSSNIEYNTAKTVNATQEMTTSQSISNLHSHPVTPTESHTLTIEKHNNTHHSQQSKTSHIHYNQVILSSEIIFRIEIIFRSEIKIFYIQN